MHRRILAHLTGLLCFIALLSACAFNQRQINDLAQQLRHSSPESTLEQLSKLDPPERDQSQYLLDLGTLQLMTGDFEASVESFEQAKGVLKSLQAFSFSENFGAVTVNETLRAYAGTPGERVMLNEVQAMNYLLLANLDGARVEALQANVLMNQVADDELLRGQLASARFVAGLVYELGGEWSDAMISYRKAAETMERRKQALPRALQDSLLLASKRMGLEQEYADYVERFGREAREPGAREGEVIAFYWDGVVTAMQQNFTSVYVPELESNVSIALPYYPPANYVPTHLRILVNGNSYQSEMLEDIESLARQGLDARKEAIYSAALARIVSKHQAVRAARKDSPFAALATNLATIFSEIADTRSWNMLPSTIQVVRVIVPAGSWPVVVPAYSGIANPQSNSVEVAAGSKVVLLAPQVSQRFFSESME